MYKRQGPEYAETFIEKLNRTGVEVMTDTTVLELSPERVVKAVNSEGVWELKADSIILSMGCRERTRGMLRIPGHRPAGIFTAGLAQYLVNIAGYLPGEEIVILGSGDIGLIMARRLTLEGARVKMVVEIKNSLSGLVRNYVQCIQDFNIPLLFSHTVTEVRGKERVEAVMISEVDEGGNPLSGSERAVSYTHLDVYKRQMSGVDIFPIIIFSDGPVIQSEITALETDSASFVRVMV